MRTVWAVAALVAGLATGCEGSLDTGETGSPEQREAALKSASRRVKTPDGKQIGTLTSKNLRVRQHQNAFRHHGGPLMLGTTNVYFIWYGAWTDSPIQPVLTDLAQNLGGSDYFDIVTTFTNAGGVAASNAVVYSGAIEDYYSLGSELTDSDVALVVSQAIAGGQLPADPDGVYFVLLAPDVNATSGLCSKYCAFHGATTANSVVVKYALIGHPGRCPSECARELTGPSGVYAADPMASLIAAELFNAITDPLFTAWYDRFAFEGADKCAWTYGETWEASNGALANVTLGTRDYLLQQLWVNESPGSCALSK